VSGASGSTRDGTSGVTDSSLPLNEQNWAFALQIYARPGIADACLRLQAEAGVDVMMLLTAVFAAVRLGVVLSAPDIKAMDDTCRSWREHIVQPLRMLRVTLKSWPSASSIPATEQLRSQIKVSELFAERLQNDMLAAWLQQKVPTSQAVTHGQLQRMVRSIVVVASNSRDDGQLGDTSSAVHSIVDAAINM
jgi:uncharacterized protein (TIGR02444 family)